MERIQKQMQVKLVLMEKEKVKYETGLVSGKIDKGPEVNILEKSSTGDEEVKRKDKKNKKKKKNKKNRVISKEKDVVEKQEIKGNNIQFDGKNEGIAIDDVKIEIIEENKESKLPKIKYNNEASKATNNINLNASSNISTETIGFYHHKPKSL
jgi:hypothetical protein